MESDGLAGKTSDTSSRKKRRGWAPSRRRSARHAQDSSALVVVHDDDGGAAGPFEHIGPLHDGSLPGGVASEPDLSAAIAPALTRRSKCDAVGWVCTQPARATDPGASRHKATRAKIAPAPSLAHRVRVVIFMKR